MIIVYRAMFGASEDTHDLCARTNRWVPECRKHIFRNMDHHRGYHSWERIATRKRTHVVRGVMGFAHDANDGRD